MSTSDRNADPRPGAERKPALPGQNESRRAVSATGIHHGSPGPRAAGPHRPPEQGAEASVAQASGESDRLRESRYQAQNQALRDLARKQWAQKENLDAAMKEISQTAAKVLGVARVGIWLFNEQRDQVRLVSLHDTNNPDPQPGTILHARDFPRYYRGLEAERILAADDAQTDPLTSEFTDAYLLPLGITSMMDAPIRVHGRMIGVVCHEHVGARRCWLPDEQSFAGSIADFIGLAIEAWERRRAEDSLKESEELYRSLVETSPDAISVADRDGRLIMANRRAAALHRSDSVNQMLGMHLLDFLAPEDRERGRRDLETVLTTGSIRNVEYTALRRDGTTFDGEVSSSLVRDASGRPRAVIIVLRDITQRNHLQQQLLQAQKLESIGTLAGGIAHDFNNLLAVIIGNASMLMRHHRLPKKASEMLNDIITAAERGSSLTQQLLAYARGGLQKPVAVDLNRSVDVVLDMLRRTCSPRIVLQTRLDPQLPYILADATQMEQVVMNLCLNAIQASTPPATVEVVTEAVRPDARAVRALGLRQGLHVRLIVRDEGCGMDAETASRMFEPFFTNKFNGRGMGLAATLGIVNSHQGQIEVDTISGRGTTMTVWLPAMAPGDVVPQPAELARPLHMEPPRGSESILVVDDNPSITRTVEQILTSLGYIVVTRDDSEEALAFIDTNSEDIDLVLLDLNMPKHSGAELYRIIRERCPVVPVVMASGYDRQDMPKELALPGMAAFLQKPFTIMKLAETIRRVLDDSQRPKT